MTTTSPTPAIETKLYVTNFPSSATRQQLQQFFSRFGRVQECAIMWNSYAFVHYASMDEARRALEQSNGAMFLNRKLIVQLSTSRFRPQPKESNHSIPNKQLMNIDPSSYHSFNLGGSSDLKSMPLSSPYSLAEMMSTHCPPSPPMKTKSMQNDSINASEIPKLYCTNLPENCKTSDLERLFSSFGHVVDCVILWDYYAFITYKTYAEADRALMALNGFNWKDRRLIVEWSRASGRRQQQQSSPPVSPPRLGSYASDGSTPSSPCSRPSSLMTHSSGSNSQFYANNSPSVQSQSPHHPFNQNFSFMSNMHRQSMPYGNYANHDNHSIYESLIHSQFLQTNSNNQLFSSTSELPRPSSPVVSRSNVYQPSDIAALLDSTSLDQNLPLKSVENSYSVPPPSCSSAALFQENFLSSLFNSFEPFNKYFPSDESNNSSTRYQHLSTSPLLTTAPDHNHSPMHYAHNTVWH